MGGALAAIYALAPRHCCAGMHVAFVVALGSAASPWASRCATIKTALIEHPVLPISVLWPKPQGWA